MAVELIVLGVRQYRELEARPGREVGPPFGWQRFSVDMVVIGDGEWSGYLVGWPGFERFNETLMEDFEEFFPRWSKMRGCS
jgi:hypothetical protein